MSEGRFRNHARSIAAGRPAAVTDWVETAMEQLDAHVVWRTEVTRLIALHPNDADLGARLRAIVAAMATEGL